MSPTPEIATAELLGLAALANVEAVLMSGDNAARAHRGEHPAWTDGTGMMPASEALREELFKRGHKV